ncbi:MAG: SDR family NAD(P)-dependent oxidoreductase [Pseudomonadota bacterium]
MTDLSEPLFLFGPGFSGHALAQIWAGPVYGTVRSEASRERLAGTKISPIDINDDDALRGSVSGAHVIISAPPRDDGCPGIETIGGIADTAASVTYLSTTGVYGDLRGGWAMEWTAPHPQSVRAERRLKAELAWQETSDRLRIVRLPGIYGPGRSALDRLHAGKARRVVRDGQVFSRIHVDDIASGLNALITNAQLGVYHLCDECAAPPQDVITYAAELLDITPPPLVAYEDADLTDMARSFYSECKRVSNAKIKAATGWRPQYPSYREGLLSIYEAGA